MKKQSNRFLALLITLTVLIILSGCAKVVLYSNLQERQVNEMLAILLSKGLTADKTPAKEKGLWDVEIKNDQIATAVELLNAYGYPRDEFESVGKVFTKSGLVSSPSEERIRYMYALSQGVAETLSQIDGVVTARVHVVLQNNDPFSDVKTPSSASVFIKYRRGSGVEALGSQIKRLVANSIEGLNYDKVSLVFVPTEITPVSVMQQEVEQSKSFDARPWFIAGLGILLILIVLGTGGAYWYLQGRVPFSKKPSEKPENQ